MLWRAGSHTLGVHDVPSQSWLAVGGGTHGERCRGGMVQASSRLVRLVQCMGPRGSVVAARHLTTTGCLGCPGVGPGSPGHGRTTSYDLDLDDAPMADWDGAALDSDQLTRVAPVAPVAPADSTNESRLTTALSTRRMLPSPVIALPGRAPVVVAAPWLWVGPHAPRCKAGAVIPASTADLRDPDVAAVTSEAAALEVLATLKAELGSLDRVNRLIRTSATVHYDDAEPPDDFVMGGFCNMLTEVFGAEGGAGVVAVVGTQAQLQDHASMQIECQFEMVGTTPTQQRPRQQSDPTIHQQQGDPTDNQDETVSLFIGGLSPTVEETELRQYLQSSLDSAGVVGDGQIKRAKVVYDRFSGMSKRCAYVSVSPSIARTFLDLSRRRALELDGWKMRCTIDKKHGGSSRDEHLGNKQFYTASTDRRPSATLILDSVPIIAGVDAVWDVFPKARSVLMLRTDAGVSKGKFVVTFSSIAVATAAKQKFEADSTQIHDVHPKVVFAKGKYIPPKSGAYPTVIG